MIFDSSKFHYTAPQFISRARRVLIKPSAAYNYPYPVSTSREMLASIIRGIRKISDADIILLEGTASGEPVKSHYSDLQYDFPRVLTLDAKDCTCVEVDNPLPKPFAVATFWVPNIILSSDYLISVSPLKVVESRSNLTIMNLLSLLPVTRYGGKRKQGWESLYSLGIDKVLADLYFTLPFDLGIVEAQKRFIGKENAYEGEQKRCGKIFMGDPLDVDREVVETLRLKAPYLSLIKEAEEEMDL